MVQAVNNECCDGLLFPPRNESNKAGCVPTLFEDKDFMGKWHKFLSVSELLAV